MGGCLYKDIGGVYGRKGGVSTSLPLFSIRFLLHYVIRAVYYSVLSTTEAWRAAAGAPIQICIGQIFRIAITFALTEL